jgi:hypothetical protein
MLPGTHQNRGDNIRSRSQQNFLKAITKKAVFVSVTANRAVQAAWLWIS